jgi:iron complex outermembrane receptor protein
MTVRIFAFLLVLGMVAPVAAGQQGAGKDLKELNLEQLMNVQFYTASKRAQNASDTPASVTVVTAEDIRSFGYRTLAEVLDGVRGYWVNYDRSYSYLGVRGFSRPGDYNTRILLLVNGHRLNDNIFYQALIGTEFPLDLDLVERIEIVRGPASSLYGTNAFLGVINVITRKPPIATRLELSTEAGSELARKARMTVGTPNLLDGAIFSASLFRADGASALYFPEFDSPTTNHGLANRVDGDRYVNALAVVKWKHFTLQGLAGSRTKIIPTAAFETIFNDSGTRTTDSRAFAEVLYQRDYASGLQLMSRWFYDHYAYRGTYPYSRDGDRVVDYDSADGDWIGSEFQVSHPLGHHQTLTSGADVRYNIRQAQLNRWSNGPAPVLDDHRNSSVVAVYAEDEWRLHPRISLTGGLRLDHYSAVRATALSPRFAVIYRPDSATKIRYTYGRAFRAPNSYELYYEDGVDQESNPRLRPETINTHNLGIERAITPELHVSAEAFLNHIDNLIDTDLDPSNGLLRYVNTHSSRSQGLELGMEVRRNRWRGELSYTLQKSEDEQTHQRLANDPLHLAKIRVQAPFAGALLAGLELRYASPQYTYAGCRIAERFLTNITVSNRKPLLGFDISASIYNLFDRSNYDPGSPNLRQLRILQDGRGFRIKIVRTFSRD